MPSLAEAFPLIRVVNLPERKDRLREMTAQLAALDSPFTPGRVETFPAIRPAGLAGFPSLGAHGCFLSHLEILRDARTRRIESVLILEDDLEVLPADISRMSHLLDSLRAEQTWSILYPGHIHLLAPTADPRWLPFDGPLGTTHCYAVHRRALPELINYLESCLQRPPGDPVGGPMHYDGALSMFRAAHPHLQTLIADPSLARQRSSRSDISVRRLEQIPGVQQLASWARTVRRRLQ